MSETNKLPALLFFLGDWLRDSALRTCSLEARGLWIDMLAFMHQGSPYGHLRVKDKDILPGVLARMVGVDERTVERLLAELEEAGVFSRTDTGTIYSRRMVRDEQIRRKRAEGGKESLKNPNVPRQKPDAQKAEGYPSAHPSSHPSTHPCTHPPGGPCLEDEDEDEDECVSSSSSPEVRKDKRIRLNGTRPSFEIFWKAYPRKKNIGDAEKAWAKLKPDDVLLGVMLAKVDEERQTADWKNEGGKYIPYPATWLNAKGWLNEPYSSDGMNGAPLTCCRRVQPPGKRFLENCGRPVMTVGKQWCDQCLKEVQGSSDEVRHAQAN